MLKDIKVKDGFALSHSTTFQMPAAVAESLLGHLVGFGFLWLGRAFNKAGEQLLGRSSESLQDAMLTKSRNQNQKHHWKGKWELIRKPITHI